MGEAIRDGFLEVVQTDKSLSEKNKLNKGDEAGGYELVLRGHCGMVWGKGTGSQGCCVACSQSS